MRPLIDAVILDTPLADGERLIGIEQTMFHSALVRTSRGLRMIEEMHGVGLYGPLIKL